ncbi:MAG: Ca-activated chloride channel family protein, partial [Alteromonadaceae bacterium]
MDFLEFHFIRPLWFYAIIPMVFTLWALNRQKVRNNGWQQIIPAHLVKYLVQGQSASRHQPFWLLTLIWLIVVSALAGPTWEKLP